MSVEAVVQATPTFGEKVKTGFSKAVNWIGHTVKTGWTKTSDAVVRVWNKFQSWVAEKFPYFGTPQGEKMLLAITITAAVLVTIGLVTATVFAIRSSYKGEGEEEPQTA